MFFEQDIFFQLPRVSYYENQYKSCCQFYQENKQKWTGGMSSQTVSLCQKPQQNYLTWGILCTALDKLQHLTMHNIFVKINFSGSILRFHFKSIKTSGHQVQLPQTAKLNSTRWQTQKTTSLDTQNQTQELQISQQHVLMMKKAIFTEFNYTIISTGATN